MINNKSKTWISTVDILESCATIKNFLFEWRNSGAWGVASEEAAAEHESTGARAGAGREIFNVVCFHTAFAALFLLRVLYRLRLPLFNSQAPI